MSIYLLYDKRMELHLDPNTKNAQMQPECPERTAVVYNALISLSTSRCLSADAFIPIECQPATEEQILRVHSSRYLKRLRETSEMSSQELMLLPTIDFTTHKLQVDNDLYFSNDTYSASMLAAGGVIACTNAVLEEGSVKRAIAVVRPPGHHCLCEKAMGFCFLNHVVIAAREALTKVQKVVIIDWDVHHGNGTQDLTYEDERITYISIHRYTGSKRKHEFFPGTGAPNEIGGNDNIKARGTNVNIAWRQKNAGGVEYAASFCELILPMLAEIQPGLILVSCGLDAAKGDLLGDCCLLPKDYYLLTKSILHTVDAPMVQVLEGGYNLDVIGGCMQGVALALLNDTYEISSHIKTTKIKDPELIYETTPELSEPIPVPQDLPLSTNLSEEDLEQDVPSLDNGRLVLKSLWNRTSNNANRRGFMEKSYVDDLNRSIRAIRNTHRWKDRIILSDVPLQYTKKTMGTRRGGMGDQTSLDEALAALKL
jgi:histone deacetylase 6